MNETNRIKFTPLINVVDNRPKRTLMYSSRPLPFPETRDSWNSICQYVKTITDVRKSMCGGCGSGYLYDKNNVSYRISRFDTLSKVKGIIEEIRKINSTNE